MMADPITITAAGLGVLAVNKASEKFGEGLAERSINLVEKAINQKWKKGTEEAKSIFIQLSDSDVFKKYFDFCIKKILSIRTLYNLSDDAFIDEFYHPLSITNKRTKEKHKIGDGFYLVDEGISNIIGTAGQGNTTILRKIFLGQLSDSVSNNKIPFFMDLRSLKNNSIIDTLTDTFKLLTIKYDDSSITALLRSKKLTLMLDGFDEVSPEKRETVLKEINFINDAYQTQIITTSRPGTEVCTTNGIKNYHVASLDSSDVFSIIRNFVSPESSEQLINALKSNQQLLSSIETPILAVLLCVCEKHLDSMPQNAKEFYSRVFNILFEGHDKTKHFYKRHRKTDLSIDQAKDIFCAISYISLKKPEVLSGDILKKITLKALDVLNVNRTPDLADNLIADYIDVTGLIRRDGAEIFTFVHKTIQEYHAAEFVRNSASSIKSEILHKMVEELKADNSMLNCAVFLQQIDTENTIEELILPLLSNKGFCVDSFDKNRVAEDFYFSVLGNTRVVVKKKTSKKITGKIKEIEVQHNVDIGPINETTMNILAFSNLERITSFSVHKLAFESVIESSSCIKIIHQLDEVKSDGVINNKNSMSFDDMLIKAGVRNRLILLFENLVEDININLYVNLFNHLKKRKEQKSSLLFIDDL
jgi:hypothetical protein